MDDPKTPPLVFADLVIQRFVNNLLGASMVVEPADYAFIKAVFHRCKGSWEQLVRGDIYNTLALEQAITQWGAMPGRKKAPSA